jgi:hypothetical protein
MLLNRRDLSRFEIFSVAVPRQYILIQDATEPARKNPAELSKNSCKFSVAALSRARPRIHGNDKFVIELTVNAKRPTAIRGRSGEMKDRSLRKS